MTTSIGAIFENGAFRPTGPVTLAEGTRVELIVVTEMNALPEGDPAKILAAIAAMPTAGGDPLTSLNHDKVLYGAPEKP